MTKLGNIRLEYLWFSSLIPRSFTARLLFGVLLASGFVNGMQQVWVDLAPTHDWVLEYRYWLVYGTRAMAVVIVAAFVSPFLVQRWTKHGVRRG